MKKRILHIDIAKGIGIILVVIGHSHLMTNQSLFNIIYSFHVPLFFLLAGIFFKVDMSFFQTIRKKADSLLKPYFTTLIILGMYYLIFKGNFSINYYLGILYGNGSTIVLEPLWFIPHLFLVFIFSWIFILLFKFEEKSLCIKLIIIFSMLFIGYLTLPIFWQLPLKFIGKDFILPGLPFSIDILLITTFYFILGYILQKNLKNIRENYFLLGLAIAVFSMIQLLWNVTIDLNLRRYDNFILSTLSALLGIFIVIMSSKFLLKNNFLSKTLSYIGANSLIILIFHGILVGKAYNFLKSFLNESELINSLIAILLAVVGSLIISEIISKVPLLRFLYLPGGRQT